MYVIDGNVYIQADGSLYIQSTTVACEISTQPIISDSIVGTQAKVMNRNTTTENYSISRIGA